MQFTSLFAVTIAALSLAVVAIPASSNAVHFMTLEEMKAWISALPASDVTLVGDPFGGLERRAALDTTVTFCSTRSGNICTGPCTTGTFSPGTCINAPNTNCLGATGEVSFCDRGGCGGSCNELNSCGTRLENNFCATPGTRSIGVPA